MIARLMYVSEKENNYSTVARQKIGLVFELTRIIPNETAIFRQINSQCTIQTSAIQSIEITEENIAVFSKNTKYFFKML